MTNWKTFFAYCLLFTLFNHSALAAPVSENTTIDSRQSESSSKSENEAKKENGEWLVSGTNTFRYETWNTFLASKSPLDKDYSFSGDRLALTLKYQLPWTTFTATVNGVKLFDLPDKATFGGGSTYFTNVGRKSEFAKAYLRTLNFTFKRIGDKGMSGTIGRFDYNNGTEYKGDNQTVEWVKSNRIASRVLGTPNFTFFQRSMNGIYLKRDNGRFQGAVSAWMPTTGTYSRQAGDIMNDVKVITLAGTLKFNTFLPDQEVQLFCYNYDDNRPIVAARADNAVDIAKKATASTGGIDVRVRTYGFAAVGAYEYPRYIIDTMVWAAFQQGDWYELAHKAYAYAVEAGYQWKKPLWKPWFRIGLNQSSGDSNPNDGEHKTFFAMLPTRKYSGTSAYNLMNARDVFAQLILKPSSRVQVRVDYHQLHLVESADRWYTGGGAMANTGTVNGFTARKTGGKTDLGSAIEFTATYKIDENFKTTLFASRFNGGGVIENSYAAEKNQNYSYLELAYDF